jgi:hypothetical protein
MSEVTGCRILKVFLTKNVKEIFWDLKFLSEVTGCQKTQVSDRTDSTVYPKYKLYQKLTPTQAGYMTMNTYPNG